MGLGEGPALARRQDSPTFQGSFLTVGAAQAVTAPGPSAGRGAVSPPPTSEPPGRASRARTQRSVAAAPAAARGRSRAPARAPIGWKLLEAGPGRGLSGPAPRTTPLPCFARAVGAQQLAERSGAGSQVGTFHPALRRGVAGCRIPEAREPPGWDLGLPCASAPIRPRGAGSSSSLAGGSGLGRSRPLGQAPAAGACLGRASYSSQGKGGCGSRWRD